MEYAIRDAGLWERVPEIVLPVNIDPLTGTVQGELAAEACCREIGKRGLRHADGDRALLQQPEHPHGRDRRL